MPLYKILLSDMVEQIGEESTSSVLSNFSCPQNQDIEYFIRKKAIEFSKQHIASTHLVFSQYKGEKVLVGYYTIANKMIVIPKKHISNSIGRRIARFSEQNQEKTAYILPSILIAQIGKNFENGYDKLLTGQELLGEALETAARIQSLSSGKVVFLECEDHERLKQFYRENGFFEFGKRKLDRDEDIKGTELIQMLKYL